MTIQLTLAELVSTRSVSHDRDTCQQLLTHWQSKLPHAQIDPELGIMWWGHLDLATTHWLIHTHLDVVPGPDSLFHLTIKGDKAIGRGTADVKGCAAILIDSAKQWDTLAKAKRLTFMLVTDEEIGGSDTAQILCQMPDLKGALFLEPTNHRLVIQAKGMMQIQIKASGRATHGSRPWDGENAIEKLMVGLAKFKLDHPTPKSETRETTFNFSQINGGTAINQVPASAELWCDVRRHPSIASQAVIDDFSHAFVGCHVQLVKDESPISCDPRSRIFITLAETLKASSLNPIAGFDHGTADARHATKLGIPALVFGPKGGGLHSDNEWVSLKSLGKVAAVLDHWIKNI